MANPGDLSSKKVKNTYKRIVQYDGTDHEIYDGTGSRIVDLNVTRITASNASLANIQDLQHLTVSRVQIDTHLSVSGSTFLGDSCADDQVKIHGNTWVSGSLTVSGSCQGTFRSIGQAKFIYLQNPGIEDQKPAKVNRGQDGTGGYHNVPRFGGENAAIDVYGNVVITGSLIVQDTIFAQEIHTEIVSQSIIYTSGSTKFGADFDDTMTVTGSIFQSGSDSFFLNGIGLGTTGSLKPGQYIQPGQANAVEFTHLLRIDDPGHNGLQYKRGKLIYGTFGTRGSVTHVSSSDTVRFRDTNMSEDVLVLSSISQSVFITNQSNIYNVGIGAPSRSLKIDEKLVVSSSKDTRVKIESGTGAKSASLYLESGRSAWEITSTSASIGATNQISGSLIFRTRGNVSSKDTWTGNGTYNEALRLDKYGRAGFNIPSINTYQYPQQVQISGSLNIIQGRTININTGTFHNSDAINGIYFNNQKIVYVSGSGDTSNYYFGFQAGNQTSTSALANIGIGRRALNNLSTGDNNIALGYDTLQGLTAGDNNIAIGEVALNNLTTGTSNIAVGSGSMATGNISGDNNIAIGEVALKNLTTGVQNIAIGRAMQVGVTTGTGNIAAGEQAGNNITSGAVNILMGNFAARNLTSGTQNVLLGYNVTANGVVTGTANIGIGAQALSMLTAGSYNVGLGESAMHSATTAQKNIVIGYHAVSDGNMTGTSNIILGTSAGTMVTSGVSNVIIGTDAGLSLTDNEYNIAIGVSSFASSQATGNKNVAIGYQSMITGDVSGDNNIAIGESTLANLTTGISNIAVGSGSMATANVTGRDNIALGSKSLKVLTSGISNISIGHKASLNLTTADNNIAIGEDALGLGIVTGDKNIAIGTDAGLDMTSGTGNILMGITAGANLLAGSYNVALGTGALDASEAASNQVAIGSNAMGVGVVTGATNVAIGANALADITSGVSNVALGTEAAAELTSGYENIALGTIALGTGIVTGHYNIALGRQSLEDTTSGNDNIALGRLAAGNLTTGISNIAVGSGSMGLGTVISHDNIAIGNFALEDNTSGGNNIAIGSSSLASATDNIGNIALGFETLKTSANDGDRNIAIGYQTMKTGDVSGADNIAIGSLALEDLSTGASNVAIGTSAALNLTTGESNIAVGNLAIGSGITTGDNNIAIGELTLANLTTGTSNIAVGSSAGDNLTSGIGNVAVGIHALDQEQTYSGNIAIGGHAGYTSTGNLNILIGSGSDTNIAAAGLPAIHNSIALGTNTTVNASNSMVIGNGTVGFKTAIGRIYTPNSTLEVSGSVRITGSLVVSSSNTTTIKGPMFVGQEVPTDAWTMAHYRDEDTNWVIDDDEMIFTVGGEQMIKITEDDTQDIITIADQGDIDLRVSCGELNTLYVEGATARVGIGTATPGKKLEVIGDISASGTLHGRKGIITGQLIQGTGSNIVIGDGAHAEGLFTIASGSYSHAEGYTTIAQGQYSHAEGGSTIASGQYSHAEGSSTTAQGAYSHAEGLETTATGIKSHAEGDNTLAFGEGSHAEGYATTAKGNYSHAEGSSTTAQGAYSHAEGASTLTQGEGSHAEGLETTAYRSDYSHAEGRGTIAQANYQHVQGAFNIASSRPSAFIIGKGTSNGLRSNLVFASGSQFQVTGAILANTIIPNTTLNIYPTLGGPSFATNSHTLQVYGGIKALGPHHHLTGFITASGNISASGYLTAQNITASNNISASGIVYGTTGSFSHLQGNSPITVGDSITFQQNITSSANISASGNLQGVNFHAFNDHYSCRCISRLR
jgi:hypothetical protein